MRSQQATAPPSTYEIYMQGTQIANQQRSVFENTVIKDKQEPVKPGTETTAAQPKR